MVELDAAGDVIGGEWTGSSKTDHPTFVWYSFGHSSDPASTDDLPDADNPGIQYSYFK